MNYQPKKLVTLWNKPWQNPFQPNGIVARSIRLIVFVGEMGLFHGV